MKLYDPTEQSQPYEHAGLAPRPVSLRGLRVALLENRKRNSAEILQSLGNQLQTRHDVALCTMRSIPTGTLLSEEVIADVKTTCDVAIVGVGD